jgi:hypothetical protein
LARQHGFVPAARQISRTTRLPVEGSFFVDHTALLAKFHQEIGAGFD